MHRFVHEPVWLPTGLHWDITGIWREIVAGLRQSGRVGARATTCDWCRSASIRGASIGRSSDKAGELVGLPHAYRDPRNQAAYEEVVAKLGAERIYQTTGIQFMALNTLYSLYAHKLADPGAFAAADRLLFMPDLFHYWLSGEHGGRGDDRLDEPDGDCHTGDWARDMLAELGLPTHILQPTSPPGTRRRHDPLAAGRPTPACRTI